jgi:ribosome biogenesis protein ENP2
MSVCSNDSVEDTLIFPGICVSLMLYLSYKVYSHFLLLLVCLYQIALYDVRSSRPLYIQEHKHGLPIHTARFHAGSGMILSADERLIKVWRYKTSATADDMMTNLNTTGGSSDVASDSLFSGSDGTNAASAMAASSAIGSVKVNIEGSGKLAHFIVAGDEADSSGDKSGVILCATADQPKMQSFYVPALGIAPKWCSFLENITEELQERDLERNHGSSAAAAADDSQETIYENYKFVSRDDLDRLGIAHLVGTPLLRGYMHGFFMDINLYNRVKAVASPFEYEAYQKSKVKERLEAKRSSRISPRGVSTNESKKKIKTAVNPDLAERLQGKAQAASATKGGKAASQMLADSRFGNLFTNKDYQIDEEDENFKLRNPSGVAAARRRDVDSDDDDDSDDDTGNAAPARSRMGQNRDGGHVDDDEGEGDHDGQDVSSAGGEESDSSDDDGFRGGKVRGEAYESLKSTENVSATRRSVHTEASQSDKKQKKKRVVMYEADDLDDDAALGGVYDDDEDEKQSRRRRRMEELNMPISKRFAAERAKEEREGPILKVVNSKPGSGGVGSKEVAYVPLDARKKRKQEQKSKGPDKKRDDNGRNRRGVTDLRLRKPSGLFHYKSPK